MKDIRFINSNVLKLIALITMIIDHIGYLFFPELIVFRIIGRISFPLFAFMIAISAHYTNNKFKHFMLIFITAIICQMTYFIYDNDSNYLNVLITFSLSTILIYSLDYIKKCFIGIEEDKKISDKIISILFFASLIIFSIFINYKFRLSYMLFGVLLPVFISISFLDNTKLENTKIKFIIDNNISRTIILALGIILIIFEDPFIISNINIQYFLFLAIPFVILYNGKKGKYNLKYLFYISYPLHLAILELIYIIINK